VLNLTVTMNLFIQLFALILLVIPIMPVEAGRTPTPTLVVNPIAITSPLPGAALQGEISISGHTFVDNFQSAELTFAYTHDPTNTWFFISETDQPVTDGVLAYWDTTTITDGDYSLRLAVNLSNGKQITATIEGLRVRNYTAIETDTPTPVTPTNTPLPGDTAIPTITLTPTLTPRLPTFTPLPPNPIELTSQEIVGSFLKGGIIVLGLFALIGIYQLSKRIRDNRNG
jgi:hypothetical protein